jgi:uncharacterized membrane protein
MKSETVIFFGQGKRTLAILIAFSMLVTLFNVSATSAPVQASLLEASPEQASMPLADAESHTVERTALAPDTSGQETENSLETSVTTVTQGSSLSHWGDILSNAAGIPERQGSRDSHPPEKPRSSAAAKESTSASISRNPVNAPTGSPTPPATSAASLRIFWYDDYEEDTYSGSIREYLESKGHTVTYQSDDSGLWNAVSLIPSYDVIVAEHTCGGGTIYNLDQWFAAGKGYVVLLGTGMYNDPPEDDYIMNLLGVGTNGDSGGGWIPSQLQWAVPGNPIQNFPNTGVDITSIPWGQGQFHVDIINGQTVINTLTGAVLQTVEGVQGAGKIVYWGSNYHDVDRGDMNIRQLVENMIVWTSASDITIFPSQSKEALINSVARYNLTIGNYQAFNDTIDLAVSSAPQGWAVDLFYDDWVTPLNDTDGDMVVDVGNLMPNSTINIVATVTIPPTAVNGEFDVASINATSSWNMSVYSNVELNTSATSGYRSTLIPSAQTGTGVPGGDMDFRLTLMNTGLNDDAYNLTYVNNFMPWPVNFWFQPTLDILHEDFEGSFPPAGWSVLDYWGGGATWNNNSFTGAPNFAGGLGTCADANNMPAPMMSGLRTPTFSLVGYSTAFLEFDMSYDDLDAGSAPLAVAEVRLTTDGGGSWYILETYDEDHSVGGPGEHINIDLSAFAGEPNISVEFYMYNDVAPVYYWQIDNVKVSIPLGALMPISSIGLFSGASTDFIARVSIDPLAIPGDFDIADIYAISQGDPMSWSWAQIQTRISNTIPWFDNMESGIGLWQANDNGMGTAWELGDPSGFGPGTAASPTNCWGTNLLSNYVVPSEAALITPPIDLGAISNPILTFKHWYAIDGTATSMDYEDGGWVEISSNFGATWSQIFPVGGYNDLTGVPPPEFSVNAQCYAGMSGGWLDAEFDLSAYAGQTVMAKFRFFTETWSEPADYAGWYVDDVYMGSPPPYRCNLGPGYQSSFAHPGDSTNYMMSIVNTGTNADIYDLSYFNNIMPWTVSFYDLGMYPITSIGPVPAGVNASFIAQVSIDPFANPGDFDVADIYAQSLGDPGIWAVAQIRTQALYMADWFDGFEGGENAWTRNVIRESMVDKTQWGIGDPKGSGPGSAYNGSNCAGTNLQTIYYPNADITLVSPYVELGTGSQLLNFNHWYQTNEYGWAYDGGFVEINNGFGWSQIYPTDGYPSNGYMGGYFTQGYSGDSGGWVFEEFDLSSWAGQVVQVRFHFASVDGWQWGWYVDNLFIGSPPPYRFELTPETQNGYGGPGTSVEHYFTLNNTGGSNDMYNLSSSSAWPVIFYDLGMNPITYLGPVLAGSSMDFIAYVTIPPGALEGDFDIAMITVTSMSDGSVSDIAWLITTVPMDVSGVYFVTNTIADFGWGTGQDSRWFIENTFDWLWPTCAYGGNILLVWDENAWYDAWKNEMTSRAIVWTERTGQTLTAADLNPAINPLVIISEYMYDTSMSNMEYLVPALENYVLAGGVLVDMIGSNNVLRWSRGIPGPFGVETVGGLNDGANYVVEPTHPMVQNMALPYFTGGSASHGRISVEPFGSTILLTAGNVPGGMPVACWLSGSPPPTIVSTVPTDGAANVNTAPGIYSIQFSEPMNITMGTIFTNLPATAWTWNADGLWLNGTYGPLSPSSWYFVDLAAGGFQSASGNSLGGDTFKEFTTIMAALPLPWSDDMESGLGGWTDVSSAGTEWQLGNPSGYGPGTAYSPSNCWGTNIISPYTNNADVYLTTPALDTSSAPAGATLSFWMWLSSEGWCDAGWVEASTDGSNWDILSPAAGPTYQPTMWGSPGYTGWIGSSWQYAEFNLTGYTGGALWIRFHFRTDSSVTSSGWYIDDIIVESSIDLDPPVHSNEYPPANSAISNPSPTIWVHVTDASTVNLASIKFYVNGFNVFSDKTSIPGGYNVSYVHESAFTDGQVVTCRIVARDIYANLLDWSWTFTVDLSPPTLVSVTPPDDTWNVPLDTQITATFSEPMNQASAQAAFGLSPFAGGTFSWNGTTMIFTPSLPLTFAMMYQAWVGSGATDLAGNHLTAYIWNFSTGDNVPPIHSNEFPAIDGLTSNLYPDISVHVTDINGINIGSIRLYIQGFRVDCTMTPMAIGYNVSYWHEFGFTQGETVTCRIVASDTSGNILDFTWHFQIIDNGVFNIGIRQGWNLISLPLVQADTSVVSVLSSIDGKWDVVKYYDSTTMAWKSYRVGSSVNTLTDLDNTMGFWLHATVNATLTVYGMPAANTIIMLKAGWNLVGYPSLNSTRTISGALFGTGYGGVEGYDAASPYLLRVLNGSYVMQPGEGYWVFVPADAMWTVANHARPPNDHNGDSGTASGTKGTASSFIPESEPAISSPVQEPCSAFPVNSISGSSATASSGLSIFAILMILGMLCLTNRKRRS